MLYHPEPIDYGAGFEASLNRNWDRLNKIDAKAKAEGTLLYRYIDHPYADGRAYYQIVKVNKRSVSIKVLGGLGDDWVLPAWGRECKIPKNLAEQFVARRDALAKLFAERS